MARSRGEGTLFQRKDGRWQASLQVNGVRKTVYGRTRQEAARKLGELQRQAMDTGALPDAGTKTVNDLLDRWLETAAPTLKARTIESYEQTCRLYVRPTLGRVRIDRLAPNRIQRLYTALQKRGLRRAPAKAHAVLHRALKLAVLWGWLAENPSERVLRPQYRPQRKKVWTPWELNAFLTRTPGHWLYPMWVLGLVTGCRLGELRALAWDDVDLEAGTVCVAKTLERIQGVWSITDPKTKSGIRTVALPPEGVTALRTQKTQQAEWRAQAGDDWREWGLVFTQWTGEPLHGATVAHGLKRECQRLGITPLTPHGLRHLHASLLLGEGLPVPLVSARLGHATPAITMAVYAHVVNQADKTAAEAMGKVLRRVNSI